MSDDLIKRADAIEALKAVECFGVIECKTVGLIKDINAIPSADRPQGEWISNHDGYWICSECGLRVLIYAKGNYCPNCGARMKGAVDE